MSDLLRLAKDFICCVARHFSTSTYAYTLSAEKVARALQMKPFAASRYDLHE